MLKTYVGYFISVLKKYIFLCGINKLCLDFKQKNRNVAGGLAEYQGQK